MRARITLAFVALLASALILAGGVSLLLVRRATVADQQHTVLSQARALAENPKTVELTGVLPLLTDVGGINADGVFIVSKSGRIEGALPSGVKAAQLNGPRLRQHHDISGATEHVVYAAVPLVSAEGTTIVLWLESREHFSDDSIWYFLIATGISLLVAASLSTAITARIARRVNTAAHAAGRIASGDFATRIDVEAKNYPELLALDASINAMAEDLERARDGERQFLLSISHDLRTPLTSIRGYAEAILEGATADLPHAAGVVVTEADRLERLINDLLDLARLRAKRFSFDLTTFDLGAIVQSAAEALPLAIEGDPVALELRLPDVACKITSDPHRIGQIVANLVENALKFAESNVIVSVTPEHDAVLLSVEDDGPGIAPEDLPNIFQRLYTSRRYPARASGTGLGLAIVAELVDALGGSVSANSPVRDGHGSLVTVRLAHGLGSMPTGVGITGPGF